MKLLERLKLFEKTMAGLEKSVVIVEGKKDEAALREVGFAGVVLTANGSVERFVAKACRIAGSKQIALLFDYDVEGRRKTRFFKERFELEGIRADDLLWKKLRVALGLRVVEELVSKLVELNKKISKDGDE
ncbi:MAG: toprim domain-containing protein [Candidatus Micrarchaeota archaeon]